MDYLPLNLLGAREISPSILSFGIFLPGVDPAQGYAVSVKIIHETDQYLQSVPPVMITQAHSVDPTYGDYWSSQINLSQTAPPARASAFGKPGLYVYRYVIHSPKHGDLDFIIDPFARESGVGELSAITVGGKPYTFSATETSWKTPALKNVILYELMISEFGNDIDGTIAHLPYLADLGINCIEIMPVSNVENTIDWGYDPIGYFSLAPRFGKLTDFQRLVDVAHQNGIAVIVDSVYGHTADDFPYAQLYNALAGDLANPFIGPFALPSNQKYGQSTCFAKKLTQDFFYSVNRYWLETFHVDGFRFDDVPEYWDGPIGQGYANLAYSTYQFIKSKAGTTDHFQRFFDTGGDVHLIQIAEYLPAPPDILYGSYSTGTWQDGTLGAAVACAAGAGGAIEQLGLQLGLNGYPESVTANGETLPKTALQYIENHDHKRFICNFGVVPVDRDPSDIAQDVLLQTGDRNGKWFKVQPYLIALLTAKGTPMLSAGQEFCEDYYVPDTGYGRVMLFRPMQWNYFYDGIGQAIVQLVRKLTKIRLAGAEFQGGAHFFYNDNERFNSKGLLAFSRQSGTAFSLVVVNFTDQTQTTSFAFPFGGTYVEKLDGQQNLTNVAANAEQPISVPSNYGCIWTRT
ncbi:MAG TPA: alpha-amylase family glycosyl hydrolase [Gemmataceae bacterium]|nr:alpha-amylase family glycosyl hydrolase [Gemmataceae bacterium]